MTDEQLGFILGIAIGLYGYKPFVSVITTLVAYIKIKRHKEITYDIIEPMCKTKEEYSYIRKIVTVKPRSYMQYLTLVNKHVSYEKTVANHYNILLIEARRLVPFSLLFLLLPLLFMLLDATPYYIGFGLVILAQFIHRNYVEQDNAIYTIYVMIRLTIINEWEALHQPKKKLNTELESPAETINSAVQAAKIPLPRSIRYLRNIALVASVTWVVVITSVFLTASFRIVPPEDQIFGDILIYSLFTYVVVMTILGALYVALRIAHFLASNRPR